jgi:class 3 adenylate cyclase
VSTDALQLPGRARELHLAVLRTMGLIAFFGSIVFLLQSWWVWRTTGGDNALVSLRIGLLPILSGGLIYLGARLRRESVIIAALVLAWPMPTLAIWAYGVGAEGGHAAALLGPWLFTACSTIPATGLLMRPRFSMIAGVFFALQLIADYRLVRPELEALCLPPFVSFVTAGQPSWLFRAAAILTLGVCTSACAELTRRLAVTVVDEQQAQRVIARLFGQYVSPEVRNKLLQDRNTLLPERREVAVLFCELDGLPSWSETRDLPGRLAALDRALTALVDEVERQGGVVDKFLGEGLMVTFGGLIPVERPALAAVRTALLMQEALHAVSVRHGDPLLTARTGMAYGVALQGPLGSAERREFTVIGDVVNVASRCVGQARRRDLTLVSARSLVAALPGDHGLPLVDLGSTLLPGREEPVWLYGLAPEGSAVRAAEERDRGQARA